MSINRQGNENFCHNKAPLIRAAQISKMRATASPNHTTMMLLFLENYMSTLYSAPSVTITDLNRLCSPVVPCPPPIYGVLICTGQCTWWLCAYAKGLAVSDGATWSNNVLALLSGLCSLRAGPQDSHPVYSALTHFSPWRHPPN
ncbi:unnamed protein product [Penicillium discolor]